MKGHDYTSNCVYHVIICSYQQTPWFGFISAGGNLPPLPNPAIQLTAYGKAVEQAIKNIPNIYKHVQVKNYVVMPNHVHLVLYFAFPDEAKDRPTLSVVMNQMKRFASMQAGITLWQRSFYDNIINDREEYEGTIQYVKNNPANWSNDEFYVPLDFLEESHL